MSGRYYWLRLKTNFFENDDIKVIESQPNGAQYIIFWQKLMLKSIEQVEPGLLRYKEEIPYDERTLATVTNTDVDVVRSAVKLFAELHMVERRSNGDLWIAGVQDLVGSEVNSAERMRRLRERQRHSAGLLEVHPEPAAEEEKAEEPEAQAETEEGEGEAVDFDEKGSPQKKLFNLYYRLHKRQLGMDPVFVKADAIVLDKDLKTYGFEKLSAYITWLFEHPPRRMTFAIRGMGIHQFLPEAVRALGLEKQRQRAERVCPHCSKKQNHTDIDCIYCGQPMKAAANVG
jgi:predicted phage replisome organizer